MNSSNSSNTTPTTMLISTWHAPSAHNVENWNVRIIYRNHYLKTAISVKLNLTIRFLTYFGGGKIESGPENPLHYLRCVLDFPQLSKVTPLEARYGPEGG
jgi:hypothetical protein